jgi:hypothetical protein
VTRRYAPSGKLRQQLTYGVLPSYEDFEEAFDAEVPNSTYQIRNDRGGADGDYTARQLYSLVKEQTELFNEDGDDEAGDFASAVLSTLGYEWI